MSPARNDNQARVKAVLFDVGNTLIFPDRNATLRPLHERGIFPTAAQLRFAESASRTTIDERLLGNGQLPVDRGYWDIYYDALLRQLKLQDAALKADLATLAGQSHNWSTLAEDAGQVLASLRNKYVLGVVSNSDERLKLLLSRLGIDVFFDCVIASSVVGYEKPDRRIFEAALASLEIDASAALYAGDIYSVDYLGATGAGIRAVLIDPYNVYSNVPVPRARSVTEFHASLEAGVYGL